MPAEIPASREAAAPSETGAAAEGPPLAGSSSAGPSSPGPGASADTAAPFWKRLPLEAMSREEWESLCDGCARCCLNKLEDWDTGAIVWTAVACELLDDESCRCSDYDRRHERVPDCIPLDPEAVRTLTWLPPSCAYRLVAEGRDLYWWHPLVSGDPETVHLAGISVSGRTVSEADIPVEAYEDFIVEWPGERPEG